ncbi:Uncharacterised protein [Mycobacterium tuberculosis]|uniref:Uncharacterized protein n=1 Tax=Mycobacterium tuberculosis TaxID=1773 RepID=A0A654TSD1_MYCTX|nr:Uncharacterised protein [Mycobacterium tuberculosis]
MAGSPGPLDKNTPCGLSSAICSKVVDAGSTWQRIPRRAKLRGVLVLIPRSRAATVNLETPGGPSGSTTYGSAVLTSPARSAPSIDCCARTRAIKSAGSASAPSENTPAFIDPRLRRWRTTARVSMPAIPTMRWRMSSSSNVPVGRQLDARGDGSRTA